MLFLVKVQRSTFQTIRVKKTMQLQQTISTLSKDVDLSNFMAENFGVTVKREGRYRLFKYHQIKDDCQKPETHDCSGVMLDSHDEWAVMSRPLDKFFNLDHGHCPIFEPSKFDSMIHVCVLAEKADGTCIQMWSDGIKWRVSTLGAISPFIVHGGTLTFEQLFWQVSKISNS